MVGDLLARERGHVRHLRVTDTLMDAIAEDDVAEVQAVLQEGGIDDGVDWYCDTDDDKEVDRALRNNPPLVGVCAYYGAVEVIKWLEMIESSPLLADGVGRTAVHFAAFNGRVEVLDWFYRTLGQVSNKFIRGEDHTRKILLHYAAENDQYDVMVWAQALLSDSDYDYKSQIGTPLHIACSCRSFRCFEFLVGLNRAVLNKNPKTRREDLPIDFNAVQAGRTPLSLLCATGSLDLIPLGLQAGMDLDYRLVQGWTLIYHVLRGGTLLSAKVLCDMGATVNTVCKNHWSPFHVAAQERRPDACVLLWEKGANPHVRTEFDKVPFQLAKGYDPRDETQETAQTIRHIEIQFFAKVLMHHIWRNSTLHGRR